MFEASEAMLVGLPARARRLLAEPPAVETMLLELSVARPGPTTSSKPGDPARAPSWIDPAGPCRRS